MGQYVLTPPSGRAHVVPSGFFEIDPVWEENKMPHFELPPPEQHQSRTSDIDAAVAILAVGIIRWKRRKMGPDHISFQIDNKSENDLINACD